MTKKELTSIDLFAGCGGFSLGLEQAGFRPIFVNELNRDALATYTSNRLSTNSHLADAGYHCNDVKDMIRDANYIPSLQKRLNETFGEIDLLVGGPPCQGFSGIGHRRSYSVNKEQLPSNHLFEDMAYVIHKLKPRAFVFENVRGLINAKWNENGTKGEIFNEVLRTMGSIPNYRVAWKLVFAKDYGVPQNRPRVLIVGMRDDIKVTDENCGEIDAVKRGFLPKPSLTAPPTIKQLLGDLIDPEYKPGQQNVTKFYPEPARTKIQKLLRTNPQGLELKKGDPLTEHDYSNHSPRVTAKFQAMIDADDHKIPEEFRTKKFAQRVLPQTWGPQGPTITATSLADDYVHYDQPRSLTVREWARLQMFPDWYNFCGPRTTGGIRRAGNPRKGIFFREVPKYTQIGNAVPVKLAEEIGTHLFEILKNK